MNQIIKFKPFEKRKQQHVYIHNKTRRVGIIITGVFPGLDEELIENLMIGNYEIEDLEKINTIGEDEEGFEFVNQFAKKYDLKVESFPLKANDSDNEYLNNERNPDIIHFVHSVLIIHGNKEGRTAAWYAFSYGKRWHPGPDGCVFINFEGKCEFEGREKEVYELVKTPFEYPFNEEIEFMERSFFELNDEMRPKFMKYLAKGEKMSFEEILLNLTKVYLSNPEKDYYDGAAYIAYLMITSMFWCYKPEYYDEEGLIPNFEKITKYLQAKINPYFYNRLGTNEDEYNSMLYHYHWYLWEFVMDSFVDTSYFDYDEDISASLSFSFWVFLNHYRGIRV